MTSSVSYLLKFSSIQSILAQSSQLESLTTFVDVKFVEIYSTVVVVSLAFPRWSSLWLTLYGRLASRRRRRVNQGPSVLFFSFQLTSPTGNATTWRHWRHARLNMHRIGDAMRYEMRHLHLRRKCVCLLNYLLLSLGEILFFLHLRTKKNRSQFSASGCSIINFHFNRFDFPIQFSEYFSWNLAE